MAKGKNQHVVPRKDGWAVKSEGSSKASTIQPTQTKAIKEAVKVAKNQKSEVVIHGRDGKIRDKDSYGNDPNPPKDKRH
ncbi:MAG TPA: DUF2188 domain-containing protein [Ignavibacteriaceae bacterium]|nr:DUF2188 domain-containing protein [Bacteroidia bacterium]HMN23355.1 DUF2188 domain-containing protein [Ignavibacteriaceae bacterium]